MSEAVTKSLVAGYRSYAAAPELTEMSEAAPSATPGILSFIGTSSTACGTAVSVISSGGVGATITWGC
ncbi:MULTISPECIES: hypothetical protein [Actinomycetes]|uniref:Uncharacterized protein n=1 Tax=Williamsia marianensis TaxID=85044 RepID=A0A315TA43_WILMA|nr:MULTISPECIES: hypothetical protein [Actinomycetes]MCK0517515.1 hypothetical protein [Williamsia sp. DF01-3]MDV7134644.1 hypothetical protein [Williamsia muralis]PVY28486.1 hypothetical protein C7458_108160 [Williamsia marianensis]RKR96765.1 hypothetical protein DFJ75_3619 [Williamsia muralis]